MQRVVYERSSDLVVGIVGEAFSGKFFTMFGGSQVQPSDSSVDFDMRGVLERTAEDLLHTAATMDGKEVRCKVLCRFGYINKTKVTLDGSFQKV